jgi:hypothetical protein
MILALALAVVIQRGGPVEIIRIDTSLNPIQNSRNIGVTVSAHRSVDYFKVRCVGRDTNRKIVSTDWTNEISLKADDFETLRPMNMERSDQLSTIVCHAED